MKHLQTTVVASLLSAFVAVTPSLAGITLHGSATSYQSTNKDWLSEVANDIDNNGLGTDGFIFFGDFQPGNNGNNNPDFDDNENIFGANVGAGNTAGLFTTSQPAYVATAATVAANSGNVGQFPYEPIDNPLTLDGTDEIAGNLLVTGSGSAVEFTVSGLAAGTIVRVGVLGAVLNDNDRARFDAPTISLTDGTDTVSVTGLPNLSDGTTEPSLGWVFFDIDSDGTYGVAVPPDVAGIDPDVTGIGGITFDSFTGDLNIDEDDDLLPDVYELAITATDLAPDGNLDDLDGRLAAGTGPGSGTGDFDGDNLADFEEYELSILEQTFPGLDPTEADTDGDDLDDGVEINGVPATSPVNEDTDDDGLSDGVETNTGSYIDATETGTNPTEADTDMDGLDDSFEVTNILAGYDPNVDDSTSDFDADALTLAEELLATTDPLLPDTDGDGFYDGAETGTGNFVSYDFFTNTGDTGTDPLNEDSDADGLLDGVESGTGNFVDASNTGSNPNLLDTDGDSFNDGIEVSFNVDPTDGTLVPDVQVGYMATGGDWLTAFGSFDIDGDGQLGTDGFIFFGDFLGTQASGQLYTVRAESDPLPPYLVSHDMGTDFASIATGFTGYGLIDNPLTQDGTDQRAGIALANNQPQGSSMELLTFEIDSLAGSQTVRVGILGGIEPNTDGRWDPTEIVLAGPNGYLEVAIELEINPGGTEAGWLFFDITNNGTYTVSATRRLATGGVSVGGLTFDSTASDIQIQSIDYDPGTEMITLTWTSTEDATYGIFFDTDLSTFESDVEDTIESDGEMTSFKFANPEVGAPRLFFRVVEN